MPLYYSKLCLHANIAPVSLWGIEPKAVTPTPFVESHRVGEAWQNPPSPPFTGQEDLGQWLEGTVEEKIQSGQEGR